jgi:hypothetical protein
MVLGPGYWWLEVDENGVITGNICSAYYGTSDKPIEGIWKLIRSEDVSFEYESLCFKELIKEWKLKNKD